MPPTIATACRLAFVSVLLAACSAPAVSPDSPVRAASIVDCGPCCGKDPATEASATQGRSEANPANPYTGKDTYTNVIVNEGTVLYSLTPGAPPGFAVDEPTLAEARGSLVKYYDLVQVTTDPGKDPAGEPRKLRDKVRAFRVAEQICAARGIARANPQFGSGGGTQYYLSPADAGKLSPGKIRPI